MTERDWTPGVNRCTPETPCPEDAPGHWEHQEAKIVGGCSEGCCDDWRCSTCGISWRIEHG